MDRVERLLGRGYLPSQVPPAFTTRELAMHHAALYAEWVDLQAKPQKGTKIPRAPSSKAELFSVARAGHQRRITSLPNPVAQTYLATHVVQHWGELLKHYRQSRISASHPRFMSAGNRGATIPSMQLLYEKKVLRSAGYKFMLRSDVSRFFPTIYTHAVPWALHGKAAAKKNKQITPKFFGNLLDLSLRQGQEEQTFGLPIGPDTSHLIAEAIATSVDVELRRRLKKWPAGFRYVDDYFFFFVTAAEADSALAALIRALKEYELQINFEKTKTCSVQEITDDFWTHQLRSFEIATAGKKQRSDVNHFFELAKNLARRNADESVMIYALKRASSALIRRENWDCFEAHLCHVALAFPNTLQTVARLFSTYCHVGYPINKQRLERLVDSIFEDRAPLGHHSEVAWGLWICKDLNLQLSSLNIDLVAEMHSSICALILLDLASAGKLVKAPKSTYWKQAETKEGLRGDLWLLSYEAGIRGWAGFSDAHIKADPYFEKLHVRNVHFYDPAATLRPVFHVKPSAQQQFEVNPSEFFELDGVEDLIDYEEGDGGYEGVLIADDDIDVSDNDSENGDDTDDLFADRDPYN